MFGFNQIAGETADQTVVRAAETVVQAVLFSSGDKPFYYGNHVMAGNAAKAAGRVVGCVSAQDPKVKAALSILDTFNAHMAKDETTGSAANMLKAAKELQVQGGLSPEWKPFAMRGLSIA